MGMGMQQQFAYPPGAMPNQAMQPRTPVQAMQPGVGPVPKQIGNK